MELKGQNGTMNNRCEIRVTNRGDDPAVLAAAVDEITGDLVRGMCRGFSCKLDEDGKTFAVSFNLEDLPGISIKEFKKELREMEEDEEDLVIYSVRFS
jgi:hypothetical protein